MAARVFAVGVETTDRGEVGNASGSIPFTKASFHEAGDYFGEQHTGTQYCSDCNKEELSTFKKRSSISTNIGRIFSTAMHVGRTATVSTQDAANSKAEIFTTTGFTAAEIDPGVQPSTTRRDGLPDPDCDPSEHTEKHHGKSIAPEDSSPSSCKSSTILQASVQQFVDPKRNRKPIRRFDLSFGSSISCDSAVEEEVWSPAMLSAGNYRVRRCRSRRCGTSATIEDIPRVAGSAGSITSICSSRNASTTSNVLITYVEQVVSGVRRLASITEEHQQLEPLFKSSLSTTDDGLSGRKNVQISTQSTVIKPLEQIHGNSPFSFTRALGCNNGSPASKTPKKLFRSIERTGYSPTILHCSSIEINKSCRKLIMAYRHVHNRLFYKTCTNISIIVLFCWMIWLTSVCQIASQDPPIQQVRLDV